MTPHQASGDPAQDPFVLLNNLERGEQRIREGRIRPAADVTRDRRGASRIGCYPNTVPIK